MSLSKKQYADILSGYADRRRDNLFLQQQRKEEVYSAVPKIRELDEEIAHISLDAARYMLFHPEEDKKDEVHKEVYKLSMEKIDLLVRNNYPADYLDPIYTCDLCKDTGFTGSSHCRCFSHYASEILFEQSNLKFILGQDSFSSFKVDYYPSRIQKGYNLSPRDNILQVLDTCHRFIAEFDQKPGKNLLIYGKPGVGKTFLSHCIARELLCQTRSVVYLTSYQLFKKLADNTFRRKAEESDIIPDLLDSDLLIIDDLGTEMVNAFVNSQLFSCVNERILARRSTIINTNLSLTNIQQIYSERLSSRIVESYKLLEIYGNDIRVEKSSTRF